MVLEIILALLFACAVGYVCRHYPVPAVQIRLIGDGFKRAMRLAVSEFSRHPWRCEHVRRDGATIAELVCATGNSRRITLPNLNIPHGSIVLFVERKDSDPDPNSPFLGSLERRLKMTVLYSRELVDDGVRDDDP